MVATMALEQCSTVQRAVPRVVTLGAHEAIGPTPSLERFGTLVLGAVLGEELPKTVPLLEPAGIARHGDSPCGSEGSSMQGPLAH